MLAGGEDESTVRFLLGFNGEETSVSLLGGVGVDSFVGMDNMEKYVGEGINLNMMPSPHTQEYIQPGTETERASCCQTDPTCLQCPGPSRSRSCRGLR